MPNLLDQMSAPSTVAKGRRITMVAVSKADQAYIPLAPGDEGLVVGGNGIQLWVEFDKGVSVTLLVGIDKYDVLPEVEEVKEVVKEVVKEEVKEEVKVVAKKATRKRAAKKTTAAATRSEPDGAEKKAVA